MTDREDSVLAGTAGDGQESPAAEPHDLVDQAILTRRSVRAFLPRPVPRALVEEILAIAARAPSGTNVQPWKVIVLTGAARERLSRAIVAAADDPAQHGVGETLRWYPERWPEPYQSRRRKLGWDLYGLLGIGRDDTSRMRDQHQRNYRFFDAPVGMIFAMDRVLERGSWLDLGMFMQTIMIAARARGLDTCPQAAFAPFHRVIERNLSLSPGEMALCGMALGYADPSRVENNLQTEREPVASFARFIDDA